MAYPKGTPKPLGGRTKALKQENLKANDRK